MTAQTRATLKTYYVTNAKPTQTQFANTIDSFVSLLDTGAQSIISDVSALGKFDVSGAFTVKASSQANFTGNIITSGALTVAGSALTNLTGNVNIGGILTVSAAGGVSTFTSIAVTGSASISGNLDVRSSANANLTGNLAVTGLITPSQTVGIKGTTTNNSVATGGVGEYISGVVLGGSAISLSNGTAANITSMSLTAGDWDVSGNIIFIGNAATTVLGSDCSISTTSATNDLVNPDRFCTFAGANQTLFQSNESYSSPTIQSRMSLSATTTVYLVAKADFGTNTMSAYGIITARRVR